MGKKKRQRIYVFLASIMGLIFIFAAYQVFAHYTHSWEQRQLHKELRVAFHKSIPRDIAPTPTAVEVQFDGTVSPGQVEEAFVQLYGPFEVQITEDTDQNGEQSIDLRFVPLLERNEDVVGWIHIPGSTIDYPVVQTTDNEFYLTHNIDREPSESGAIFMDFRNAPDVSDRHTILYGHHMRDGSMFAELIRFRDEDFFYTHPLIRFDTRYEQGIWEIFSAYITSIDFYYIVTDFRSSRDYVAFLEKLQEKSLLPTDIALTAEDQILTLSTCTYDFDDARFVVHARRVN